MAWDAGTPEARSGKTSFPLEVTAPRIIGRGATVLRAEIRDVAELGDAKKAIEAGVDATQGALIRALDGPKDAFVKRWLEERGPLSTKDPSIADPQIWTRGASDRSRNIVWGTVLDGYDGIVWQAPNTEELRQTLALLERLGGGLRLSNGGYGIGSGLKGTYGVVDPRARPKKGIVGSLMSLWRSGDDDEASAVIDDDDDDPALARKVEHWVKLFRIVRAVPQLMIACDRWRAGRAKRRAARREKKKALPTLPPKPLKAPGGRDYVAKREVTFVVPAHNVLEARAVEGAAHKLSSFMAGVRAAARDGARAGRPSRTACAASFSQHAVCSK